MLALTELPLGLKETYHGMWRKVQKQRLSRKSLAEQALELLLYSVQPLSANAVAEAVTPDDHLYEHENEIVDVALILDVCQSLVVLDSELGILRPIHFTAQTFLKDHFPESGSHSRIAVNCLRHISNQATLNKATNMSFNGADTIADFAIYAILNWPVHTSRGDKNSKVESLERDLMRNEMLHRLWIRNLRVLEEHSSRKHLLLLDLLKAYPKYPDASLISACFFGLRSVELAIHFQPLQYRIPEHPAKAEDFSWKPSETGIWSVTGLDLILSDWRIAGLLCASEQGHAFIVTQLLKCIPNKNEGSQYVNNQIRYALECCTQFAIANGHVNIVDAFWKFRDDLLFTRFDWNSPYCELGGGTLALAAFRGQRKVIELLLSSYCPRPERSPSDWKSTAARWQNDRDFDGPHWMLACDLTATARWHNEKAFALLLSYANSHNNLTSALFSAASANTGKIIELILETSTVSLETLPIISPGVIKSQNQTPFVLVNAIERWNSAGEITTARAPAAWARTALITAAWGDCGAAGKALCRDSRVDLHICDESGMNALQKFGS